MLRKLVKMDLHFDNFFYQCTITNNMNKEDISHSCIVIECPS